MVAVLILSTKDSVTSTKMEDVSCFANRIYKTGERHLYMKQSEKSEIVDMNLVMIILLLVVLGMDWLRQCTC